MKQVKDISGSLPKSTKDKYLGKSKMSLSALKRNNNEHLKGLYIEEI